MPAAGDEFGVHRRLAAGGRKLPREEPAVDRSQGCGLRNRDLSAAVDAAEFGSTV